MSKYLFIDVPSMNNALLKEIPKTRFIKRLPFIDIKTRSYNRVAAEILKPLPYFLKFFVSVYSFFWICIYKKEPKKIRELLDKEFFSYKIREFKQDVRLYDNLDLLMYDNPEYKIVLIDKGNNTLPVYMVKDLFKARQFNHHQRIEGFLEYLFDFQRGKRIADCVSKNNIEDYSYIIIDSKPLVGGLESKRIDAERIFKNTCNDTYDEILKLFKGV